MSGFKEYDNYDGLGLAELVQNREISALELLEEAIDRTEHVNGELNGVVCKFYDKARSAAARGPAEGPFCGVPFLLKDLDMQMNETVCTNGSSLWRDAIAHDDNTLVRRYKDAGLVIFGKTNSPELGLNPVTEPTAHGPSRNPWNTRITPGGSSGGSAAMVAAGVLPIAHASDGGGSIRIPASCCGLVGLKPSRGRIPHGPDKGEGWAGQSTSHVVSRTVRDCAAMLDATAGPECGEPYSAPHFSGSFLAALDNAPRRLRIAFSREKWGLGEFQPDIVAALDQSVTLLSELGHEVEETRPEFDGTAGASALFTVICVSTAHKLQLRAEELGCSIDNLDVEDGTRMTAERGLAITATDYAKALHFNHQLGRILGRFHEQYDVSIAPTLASPPVPVGYISEASAEQYGERMFGYMGDTPVYNQTGQPSISLPLHWNDAGLPIGMMFSAAYGNDALVLQLARQLELAVPWHDRRPPLWSGDKR
ncbi:MAG: amidase [Halioglobus sp.]|nr:amidase [Halioglobus sp.]